LIELARTSLKFSECRVGAKSPDCTDMVAYLFFESWEARILVLLLVQARMRPQLPRVSEAMQTNLFFVLLFTCSFGREEDEREVTDAVRGLCSIMSRRSGYDSWQSCHLIIGQAMRAMQRWLSRYNPCKPSKVRKKGLRKMGGDRISAIETEKKNEKKPEKRKKDDLP